MIAIIAILAAILVPIFVTAKSEGRRGACAAHMKQIATAMAAYADDYCGFLPDCVKINPDGPGHNDHGWPAKLHVKLQRYCRSGTLFWCPGDRFQCVPYPKPGGREQYYTIFSAFGSSYQNYAEMDCYQRDNWPALNRMQSDLYGVKWPILLSGISRPTRTRLVRDAIPFHNRSGGGGSPWHWNEIFADGHIQTMKSSEQAGGDPSWGFSYDTGGIL